MHTWHSGCAVAKLGTRDALCMYLWQEGLKTSTAAQPSVKTIMSSARWLLMHIYECTVYILSTSQGPPISTTRCKSGAAGHAPGKSLLPISTSTPHGHVIRPRHTGGAVRTDGHTVYRTCKDQRRLRAKGQVVPHAPPRAALQHWNQAGSLTMLDTLFLQQAIKRVTSRQWTLLLIVYSLHTHGYALPGCICTRPWPGPRPCKFHANTRQGNATDVLLCNTKQDYHMGTRRCHVHSPEWA